MYVFANEPLCVYVFLELANIHEASSSKLAYEFFISLYFQYKTNSWTVQYVCMCMFLLSANKGWKKVNAHIHVYAFSQFSLLVSPITTFTKVVYTSIDV